MGRQRGEKLCGAGSLRVVVLMMPCARHLGTQSHSVLAGAPAVGLRWPGGDTVLGRPGTLTWLALEPAALSPPPPPTRYFPFGIVFLIAGKILEMDDPTAVGKKLGFYAVTVVCGLVVHGLFILPLLYFVITKKNPIVFIRGVLQALLIALATSSR